MQRYTVYFIWKRSTCFGWYNHPSPGAQTTVSTASGICHAVTATCRIAKHVEQFSDINKLCKVASFWIYILECIYDAQTHKR